jgi:hypothetical protein
MELASATTEPEFCPVEISNLATALQSAVGYS